VAETREDRKMTVQDIKKDRRGVMMDHPYLCLAPVLAMGIISGVKYQLIGI